MSNWLFVGYSSIIAIFVIFGYLWSVRKKQAVFRIVVMSGITLIAYTTLIITKGSFAIVDDPENSIKLFIALLILLTYQTYWQLVKWEATIILAKKYNIHIPKIAIDLAGLVFFLFILLIIINRIFLFDLTRMLVTSTVLSAVIGLSLQGILVNLFSGIILQIEAPVAIGDWIQIHDYLGKVIHLNWRTITIETHDLTHVIITNSSASTAEIINLSRPDNSSWQTVSIHLDYDHPPGKVEKVLANAVLQIDEIVKELHPEVRVNHYGESAIYYDVRYAINNVARKNQIRHLVLKQLWYAVRQAHLHIPMPVRDINVHQQDHSWEEREKQREVSRLAETLTNFSLFKALNPDQLKALAQSCTIAYYTAENNLVTQGDEGDSMFLILSGYAEVFIGTDQGGKLKVDTLATGAFFGEMSLLTGEPRTASVIAGNEMEVIVINKDTFAAVLSKDPSVIDTLLDILELRKKGLEEKKASNTITAEEKQERNLMLSKIRNFLGIQK